MAVLCPYCGDKAKLVEGSVLYSEKHKLAKNLFYSCGKCDAWVGTHQHSRKPFGTLANATLRKKRVLAHSLFDPIWIKIIEELDVSKSQARNEAYRWLAEKLNIDFKDCHIGMFDEEMCNKTISLLIEIKRRNDFM